MEATNQIAIHVTGFALVSFLIWSLSKN